MKVYTTLKAWNKMSYWAALGGTKHREFTCFGRAVQENGDFRVTDVYLVKQEGSAGGVDGDDEDINRLMMELFEKGIEPDEAFRCWIHSHPGTGPSATYLSGTDDQNIERYLTGSFLISIVLDSKGDNPFCQIDIKEPRMSIRANLQVELPSMTEEAKKECEEEFKEKSSGITYTTYKGKGKGKYDGDYPLYGRYADGYGGGYPYDGHYGRRRSYNGSKVSSSGGKSKGKGNGVAPKKKKGGGAKGDEDIVRRPNYNDLDGMTLFGIDQDEYDAWLAELEEEDRGAVADPVHDDTDKIETILLDEEPNLKEIEEAMAPEWVIAMADKMACSVSLLVDAINVQEYDKYIDEIVFAVQCGYKTHDDAVDEIESLLGIDRDIAAKEITARVNA
jgi:hypothetical protein